MSKPVLDTSLLEAEVRRRGESALTGIRSAALARLQASGLPGTRDEDWKYTSLAPVAELSNAWLESAGDARSRPATLERPSGVDAHWLDVRNGRVDDDAVRALDDALGDAARVYRLSTVDDGTELYIDDAVSSLNAALMEDAICIDVAPGASLDKPVALLLADEVAQDAGVSQVRLVLRLPEASSADFIELHRSSGDAGHYASLVVELTLEDAATCRYVKLQERAPGHIQTGRLQLCLGKDSRFEHASIDVGGRLIRNDVSAVLMERGASFSSSGLFLAEDGQHIDNHICADHRVGPTVSRQNYRGIASGRSRCVFNGKALVREGADGTDAEQSNHNLLLSKRAEVDTKPELEIYAEDVKCSHGATVGQLDRRALFYLRSRGLDEDEAAQLLTRAFASIVVRALPLESLQAFVEGMIDRKLDRLVEEIDP